MTAFTAKIVSSNISYLLKEYDKKKLKLLFAVAAEKIRVFLNKLNLIRKNLSFYKSEDFQLNGDFVESQAFGYLAIRSLLSLPISFPLTTGCSAPCSGGEIIEF